MTTIVVFNLFDLSTKTMEMKYVSKHEDFQIFVLKLNTYKYFFPTLICESR